MRRALCIGALAWAAAACGSDLEAGGADVDAGVDDDPLIISDEPAEGSLDYIQKVIIQERCSGQPGLCHNGQFEPNLSTASNTYSYLVNRPGLEKRDRYRVEPGDPDSSLLIDKIRNRQVSTQMPLGAEPLAESEIAMIEAWIEDGALRRPGAVPAPQLNNPPSPPEIAIFDTGGTRLDTGGQVPIAVGTTIRLRHSVEDFETADADIPFATFILSTTDGRNVVLSPGADDPENGVTSYDPGGPMGNGDTLNYMFQWTVPATLDLIDDDTGATSSVAAAGQVLTPIVLYVDGFPTGIVGFEIGTITLALE